MELKGNTVLVTGGGTGIGLGIAAAFLKAGSAVVICGRREDKLREAQAALPGLQFLVADVESAEGRLALCERALRTHPELNVLVNNAGIQRYPRFSEPEAWEETRREIATNLEAPLHLCALFLPHFLKREKAGIVNVTSGLAFAPLARAPVYSATKAALHSFTLSLRHELAGTAVEVVEIIPPAVNTDLGGPGLHTFGVAVGEFVPAVMERIAAGENEVGFAMSEVSRKASRQELEEAFRHMNGR